MATKKDTGLDPMDKNAPSPEAATRAPENLAVHYEDNPDKPHETSIAQIQVVEEV